MSNAQEIEHLKFQLALLHAIVRTLMDHLKVDPTEIANNCVPHYQKAIEFVNHYRQPKEMKDEEKN